MVVTADMVVSHFSVRVYFKLRGFRLFDAAAGVSSSHSDYLITSIRALISYWCFHRIKPGVSIGITISVVAGTLVIVRVGGVHLLHILSSVRAGSSLMTRALNKFIRHSLTASGR